MIELPVCQSHSIHTCLASELVKNPNGFPQGIVPRYRRKPIVLDGSTISGVNNPPQLHQPVPDSVNSETPTHLACCCDFCLCHRAHRANTAFCLAIAFL